MGVEFRSIVESLPDGVLVISNTGAILFVNAEGEEMLGYRREQLIDRSLEVLVPDRFREAHKRWREAYIQKPVKRPMGKVTGIVARRCDGSDLPVDVNLNPSANGTVVATFRDARTRLRTERELRQLAEALEARVAESKRQTGLLESIVHCIGDGVIVVDVSGRLQLINPAALRILPTARERLPLSKIAAASGAFLSDQTTPCCADELLLSRVLKGENVDGLEVFVRHSSAAEGIWATVNGRPLKDENGAVAGAVLAIRDITERKSAQEALMAAQEAERKRIARELHDSASQILCAVILEMEKIVGEMPNSDAELRSRAVAQKEILVELADEVNSVAHRLHPAVLERVGLSEAMERVCREFQTKGLNVEFSQRNITPTVSASSALCVYRVAQEALRNVLRHARAKTATVTLTSDGSALHLSITDAGVGFDVEEAAAKGRLGLVSIRERVRLAGGTLAIHSRPGHGARIEVSIPVNRAPARQARH
jgi:PAS domain S-box-containing protein